jgi:predicted secreted hydrolase
LDTNLRLNDWSLRRTGADLRAQVKGSDFALDLHFASTQPVLLQGDQGLSRKGPDAAQASYYYSLPQMRVQGDIVLNNTRHTVTEGSTGWLDHEWSQEVLHPAAVGWDWIGINLFDGSALTAFQLRDKAGLALWDGGSFRSGSRLSTFIHGEVVFKPVRIWRSPVSQASYPVEWTVRTPTGTYAIKAVIDPQELDSRASTGAIYWEGLCEVRDGQQALVGRGYLEMTGYAAPMKM